VRHVRMLGFCLVALVAFNAMTAGSAMAKKSQYSSETWEQYKNCPYTDTQVQDCFAGITSGGKNGGYFQIGNARVALNKPVTLQGGFYTCENAPVVVPECEELGYTGLYVVAPTNGAETLESPELKLAGGLKLITSGIQERAEWPQALKESFKEAKKNKETGVYVKIEVAGNQLYENPAALSTENLLFEEGPAFELPLKVKVTNSWLEKLGGGPCTLGNEEHPIMQYLTTENPGRALEEGGFHFGDEFTNIALEGSRLQDFNWPVEEGAGATGCGGAYESYVDAALNDVTETSSGRHGVTFLQGNLYTGLRRAARAQFELGNWERYKEVE
jgi:hypothetical protein